MGLGDVTRGLHLVQAALGSAEFPREAAAAVQVRGRGGGGRDKPNVTVVKGVNHIDEPAREVVVPLERRDPRYQYGFVAMREFEVVGGRARAAADHLEIEPHDAAGAAARENVVTVDAQPYVGGVGVGDEPAEIVFQQAFGGRVRRGEIKIGLAHELQAVVAAGAEFKHVEVLLNQGDCRQEALSLQAAVVELRRRAIGSHCEHDAALGQMPEQFREDHRVADIHDVKLVEVEQAGALGETLRDLPQRCLGALDPGEQGVNLAHELVEMHACFAHARQVAEKQVQQEGFAAPDVAPNINAPHRGCAPAFAPGPQQFLRQFPGQTGAPRPVAAADEVVEQLLQARDQRLLRGVGVKAVCCEMALVGGAQTRALHFRILSGARIVMTPTGPLMVFLEGTRLAAAERDLLRHPAVGGVIFFSRNYNDREQLSNFIYEIKEVAQHLILAVDHEGGRVQRLRRGFTRLPPMRWFGRMFEREPERALHLSYAAARLAATELSEIGIHTGFSPVLDLAGANEAIGDRALHADPGVVVQLGREFIAGLRDGGLLPVGKHFPGHGTVSGDTHNTVVEDRREYAEIEAADLSVFRELIARAELAAVMAAHVVYPQVDTQPAGLSERWLKRILRDEIGFDGLVFSDDLAMRGVRAHGGAAPLRRMLEAGCDMVLICRDRRLLRRALAELSDEEIRRYAERLGQRFQDQRVMAISSEKNQVNWDLEGAREELAARTGEQHHGRMV